MPERAGPVLVIGATGNQGGAAARALLARGWPVRAFVRDNAKPAARALDAAGAELVSGDLDDPASLRAAMRGVHGVFVALTMMNGAKVTTDGVAAEERRGRAVAELAAHARIGQLVYSSINGTDQATGISYIESKARIEARIRTLGLPATVLWPVSFMENFAAYNRPVVADGTVTVSLALRPETPLPMIAARDIGIFAAMSARARRSPRSSAGLTSCGRASRRYPSSGYALSTRRWRRCSSGSTGVQQTSRTFRGCALCTPVY